MRRRRIFYRRGIDAASLIYLHAGQYELEEREDADSAKTLMELTADGKALLGSTDGVPFADSKGRWEYDGKELILELTRTFEDVKSAFSTTRVFIGDVIALNDVSPQVQGAVSHIGRHAAHPAPHAAHVRRGLLRRREDPRDPGHALGEVTSLTLCTISSIVRLYEHSPGETSSQRQV